MIYTSGQTLGTVTFVKDAPSRSKIRRATFLCHCGNEFDSDVSSVKRGNAKSCGCIHKANVKRRATTHGLYNHPLHSVWTNLKARCSNESNTSYVHYGARGISVCHEWSTSFRSFYDFCITHGWEKGLQIDRRNNDGNYEPLNCHFITSAENKRNTRANKLNWDVVNDIRNVKLLIPSISNTELALAYSVTGSFIGKIISNKAWMEVTHHIP